MRFCFVFWVLSALLAACGDKGAVSLSASIPEAEVSVKDNPFGAGLEGSFRLELALGGEASGSTSVTPGNFQLQTEAGAALVDLPHAATTTVFPLQVGKGEVKSVSFTLKEDSVDRAALCAGKVRIVGSVLDSLKGATEPVQGQLFTPDCGSI